MPRSKAQIARKEEIARSKEVRFEQFLKKQSKQSNLTSDQLEMLRAAFEAGWEASNKHRLNETTFIHNPQANAKGNW